MTFQRMIATLFLATLLSTITLADDWPQWRGPSRDGVWHESGLLEKFPDKQIKILWRAKISSGYSGPTVAQGRVFVSDRKIEADPQNENGRQTERIHCFDAVTGKPLWSHQYDCKYRNISYQAGPRASISIDDGRAFSLGTMGHLFCFAAADGKVLWKRDLGADYAIKMPIWGIASSPLVFGDLLILQIGGKEACMIALEKKTGKERWRALKDRASYAAPIVIRQAGKQVLVCWTGDHVAGLNPLTGEVHWKHPFTPKRMVLNVATPVAHANRLFVTAFYDGSLMLRLDTENLSVKEVWRRRGPSEKKTDSLHSIISTPYLQGDHVYGVDSYGQLRCLDGATGDRLWENLTVTSNLRWGNIHMVRNGKRIWMFNDLGELIIGELSPKGFKEISRAKLISPTRVQLARRSGVCWAHPAYAGRHVFARNDKEIICANLAAE
jgi:outer membrane protein assembly factor BamB